MTDRNTLCAGAAEGTAGAGPPRSTQPSALRCRKA
jgi:hypothetical protein